MTRRNSLGLPIGDPLPAGWAGAMPLPVTPLEGRRIRLEPVDPPHHAPGLHAAFSADTGGRIWTYLGYGPFPDAGAYRAFLEERLAGPDPQGYVVREHETGRLSGIASYLRINPAHGVIEVGHICFAPALQATAAATETMFMMMRHVFDDLGYRRYEWKCDALNARSVQAARRLGFRFEGIFRQATTYKGRNRDTAWFAVLDCEWPVLRTAYETWLADGNFDRDGNQRLSLAALTGEARRQWDGP